MTLFARACPIVLPLLLLLGGCAHRAPVAPVAATPTPPPFDHQAEVDAIVGLLDRGDLAAATPRVAALLARDPADPAARVLQDSIARDPVELLGPRSFPYTVGPGETMLELAARFLGTTLKSYELARYNGIAVPASLAAGTVLRIPGVAVRASPPPARPRPDRPKAKPVPPKSDPAAARQARAAGLAALAQGQLDRALAQLRRAAALDPADPLIQRDLARAQRVAATVQARP